MESTPPGGQAGSGLATWPGQTISRERPGGPRPSRPSAWTQTKLLFWILHSTAKPTSASLLPKPSSPQHVCPQDAQLPAAPFIAGRQPTRREALPSSASPPHFRDQPAKGWLLSAAHRPGTRLCHTFSFWLEKEQANFGGSGEIENKWYKVLQLRNREHEINMVL